MKTSKKILAVMLTIATLIGIFSCATTVFAEDLNKYADDKAYQKSLLTEAVETESEQSEIVCEVPEKRDEFSKTYKRADGSFTSVVSKTPIHKLENGEWEEINNTLETKSEAISNVDGAFDVEFPETITEDEQITVSNNGESIAFSVNGIENSEGVVEEKTAETDVIKQDLEKTVSQITYENVDENTDIQYVVSSNYVKENIIVSNKESLKEKYSFDIEKGNLSAELDDENNLIFKNDKNEVAFTIPAPVMTDANNAVSYDIGVSVENADKSVLTLTYAPSKEWLNSSERAYPVVIDPLIKLPSGADVIIEDTMIYSTSGDPEEKNTNYSDFPLGLIANHGTVGTDNFEKGEVLVKFDIDAFKAFMVSGLTITSIKYMTDGNVVGGNLLAKPINEPWNSKTITYEDVYPTDDSEQIITYGTEILDYYTGAPLSSTVDDAEIVNFDITEIFYQWLNGEKENNGFAIVADNTEMTAMLMLGGFVESINTGAKTYFDSYVAIDYVDTNCTNDSFEYLTQEVGRAGTINVNTFSRSVSLMRSDLSIDGLRMPVTIGNNYNSSFDTFFEMFSGLIGDPEIANELFNFPYGKNWKPSALMGLFAVSENQYQLFTEEGTIVTFNQKTETTEEIIDGTTVETTEIIFEPDETSDGGYSLELIDQTAEISDSNLKIITSSGEEMYLNGTGLVGEIREEEPNADGTYDKISIVYDNDNDYKIDYVTDGIGRKYDFIYNSETDLLSEIKCLTAEGTPIKAGTTNTDLKVTYGYDSNNNLTSVTYPDGEMVSYTYDSNGSLVKAQNIDSYNIQYTYDNSGKVTHIAEYAGNTPGNTIDLVQLSGRQVKVVDSFNGAETYQFGKDGKLHYTFDEKGNYLKSDYASANDENVYSSNDWSISSQNLLKNGSFEEIRSAKALNWSNSFNVEDIEPSEALTDYACRVSAIEATNALQSQTVAVNGGESYTFSLYAKSNLSALSETDRLYMRITAEDEEGNETSKSRQISPTENFEQYSITISTETEIFAITVEFGLKGKTGDFYVNNAQLEKGYGTAPFNYIKNGSFNNSDDNWTIATIVDETLNGESVKAVKLSGGLPQYNVGDGLDRPADTYYLEDHISATTQNVKINGKKGETYSIGGWFKGKFDDNSIGAFASLEQSVITEQPTNSTAQIKVTYSYLDEAQQTITENFVVDFAPHNDNWQYAVDTFALKGDTESVDVTVMAKNIVGDCFATGISFEQDFNSEVIEEDDEETEDSDSDAEEICTCGCEDCYYGENCPCTGAINDDCQCPECLRKETSTQDNFGNTLSNKSTDGIHYIETFDSYTADGNNVASYTDENGNVVTYDYDLLSGILKSVTSPIGTENETTTTNYSYDEMGKVVSVSTTVSDNQNQALQYVYVKDRLTEIITPNGKYGIIYDDWGQVRSVNVVTGLGESENVIPLVEYTYNNGAKRTQIKTATYKNSSTNIATYRYEYYDNGTLEKVFLNEEQIHFVEYNNLGVLESIENTGGRKVEYIDEGTLIYNPDGDQIYSTLTNDDGTVTEENYGVTYKTLAPENDYDSATGISTETEKIEINSDNRIAQQTQTDYFGRTKSQNISVYNITNETEENPATLIGKIKTEYGYSVEEDGKTSSSIEKFINKTYNGDSESYRVYDGYYYEYDKQNKISAEKTLNADGTTTDKYSYEYDKLGQLVRFNDAVANKTYTYTYDNNGNILTKSEYAYTLTDDLGTATNITNFSYETQWKDRLSTVGNQQIEYDNIGNPTSYLGATLTWEGRNLKSYETEEQKLQYEYDENGMRYRTTITNKEDNSVGYLDYVWVDSKLISISFTSDELNQTVKYLYNDFDEPVGFVSTREDGSVDTYYYLKNAQGDITNIVSAAGKKMVSFTYDVFGKRTVEYQANGSTNPGQIELLTQMKADLLNPFAYRGYCYDYDMGMYYLQSRYYDPNTGRFINADDTNYLNATGTVLGCNLFAYCENDPVNFVDPRGTVSFSDVTDVLSSILTIIKNKVSQFLKENVGVWKSGSFLFIKTTTLAKVIDAVILVGNAIKSAIKATAIKGVCSALIKYFKDHPEKFTKYLKEKGYNFIASNLPSVANASFAMFAKILGKKIVKNITVDYVKDKIFNRFSVYRWINTLTSPGTILANIFDMVDSSGWNGQIKIKIK